jgi:hypothetical protein
MHHRIQYNPRKHRYQNQTYRSPNITLLYGIQYGHARGHRLNKPIAHDLYLQQLGSASCAFCMQKTYGHNPSVKSSYIKTDPAAPQEKTHVPKHIHKSSVVQVIPLGLLYKRSVWLCNGFNLLSVTPSTSFNFKFNSGIPATLTSTFFSLKVGFHRVERNRVVYVLIETF